MCALGGCVVMRGLVFCVPKIPILEGVVSAHVCRKKVRIGIFGILSTNIIKLGEIL